MRILRLDLKLSAAAKRSKGDTVILNTISFVRQTLTPSPTVHLVVHFFAERPKE